VWTQVSGGKQFANTSTNGNINAGWAVNGPVGASTSYGVGLGNFTTTMGTTLPSGPSLQTNDGTFETFAGWTPTSGTFAQSTVQHYEGTHSGLLTVTGTPAQAQWRATTRLAVTAGSTYRCFGRAFGAAGLHAKMTIDWYNSGGTVIFSVSGHVAKPGNFEVPLGIPFADLLELAGGIWKGRQLKAVIPGGSSVPVVPGQVMLKTTMDYDALKAAGSSIGSAAVIVMDETTCMVRTLERLSRFYMAESCGQCTPCREGTGWLDRTLKRILAGQGDRAELDLLLDVANRIEGHTICGLGDAAAWPVQSFLKHYRHEFEYMVDHGGRSIVDAARQAA